VKVAHVGDLHLNLRSRREEAHRVAGDLLEDLCRQKPDLILFAGDLSETAWSGNEEHELADFLRAAAEIAEVVAVAGNHDLPNKMPPRSRIPVSELRPTKHRITVVDSPRIVYTQGAAIACLPWPRGGRLLAVTGDATKEERHAAGVAGLRAILLAWRAELEQFDGARILLAHTHVRGARLGAHVPERQDFETGVEDLAGTGVDYVALGHLHEHQHWIWNVDGRAVPVVYAGSLFANTFGETDSKGYVMVQFYEPMPLVPRPDVMLRRWEFVPSTATPLAHINVDFQGIGQGISGDVTAPAGSSVRFRYTATDDNREAAARAAEQAKAKLLAEGAKDVTIEPVIEPTVRARMPEVARAESAADQVAMLLRQQGESDERVARLREMTASLERTES